MGDPAPRPFPGGMDGARPAEGMPSEDAAPERVDSAGRAAAVANGNGRDGLAEAQGN